jgi:hypothetical protein
MAGGLPKPKGLLGLPQNQHFPQPSSPKKRATNLLPSNPCRPQPFSLKPTPPPATPPLNPHHIIGHTSFKPTPPATPPSNPRHQPHLISLALTHSIFFDISRSHTLQINSDLLICNNNNYYYYFLELVDFILSLKGVSLFCADKKNKLKKKGASFAHGVREHGRWFLFYLLFFYNFNN